ncbi:hypothetical protein ACN9ML_13060 [Dyadobacter endophyticus]|uniref:hypothetical protein n=1 Tax=Dyadobacter endophyticus TaxID=1749036 RepID=UPI003CFAF1DD
MNTNTENKNELAAPISFGVTFGLAIGAFLGPAGAIGGFVLGAAVGFWFDRKESESIKSSGEAAVGGQSEKQSVIDCNH